MMYTVLAKHLHGNPVRVATHDPREAFRRIQEFRKEMLYVVAHDETGRSVNLDDLMRIIEAENQGTAASEKH